jgi:hypothetical protein
VPSNFLVSMGDRFGKASSQRIILWKEFKGKEKKPKFIVQEINTTKCWQQKEHPTNHNCLAEKKI